jgi:hypothetical protein
MWQQGQVFKLKAKGREGQPLWAYRYRLEGRGSVRPQVGGFATRSEALKALEKVLARLGPGGRAATMTLGELVDEYLEMHQAEPVTLVKLRGCVHEPADARSHPGTCCPARTRSPCVNLRRSASADQALRCPRKRAFPPLLRSSLDLCPAGHAASVACTNGPARIDWCSCRAATLRVAPSSSAKDATTGSSPMR